MIEIRTIEVSGFKGAIYGMRNPFKNREKSDSVFGEPAVGSGLIGLNDLKLCQKLLRAGGDDDSKFMRYIHVQADVNAPLYWWKEFDTYKVSTVANSESTMHTIHKREFTLDDFSWERLDSNTLYDCYGEQMTQRDWAKETICLLNHTREKYLKAVERKDPQAQLIWKQMIQILPSSYMQKRTVDLNYQTLRRIYFARRNHKLTEWSGENGFCGWIKTLPYAEELITYSVQTDKEFNEKKRLYLGRAARLTTEMVINSAVTEDIQKAVEYSAAIVDADQTSNTIESIRTKFDISELEKKYLKEDK